MHVPCRWLAAALFIALTIPRLAQPGMFSDGVVYASIARNMAEGNGSFWSPAYTQTIFPQFYEHPPLGLGLQSLAFRLAGDHLAVERVYALACGALTALLIAMLWRRTAGDPRGDWLPIVFWLVPSTVTWGIINNMLETTQALFTTAAVVLGVVSMTGRWWIAASAGAGTLAAAAVLVKGPVGLFPAAVPVLYTAIIERRSWKRSVLATAVVLVILVGTALVMAANAPARHALATYLQSQLVASLTGGRGAGSSRVLATVGVGIVLRMAGLLAIAWVVAGMPRWSSLRGERWIAFFLTLGLCASLPIAVSPRQMGHYFVPSIPFFALAFALPAWRFLAARIDRSRAGRAPAAIACTAAVALFVLSAAVPLAHGPIEARDVGLLQSIRSIAPSLPRGGVVATCPLLAGDWSIHAYLQRFYKVSLDAVGRHRTFLRASDPNCGVPERCLLVRFALGLEAYACDGAP